uniref:Phospholipase A2 n=1 Tax=Eucampia antarctica TaxID=49252 RepID=A0A7S2RDK9_9STRA|mmetsp:Transcript_20620/g.19850  ORF Transcript_20620/g.19850 Transcript_20620/m.19850 type:complete len:164 (+) Transcript_20620:60-551(+)
MTKLLFGLALSILLTASAAQEFDPMSGVKEACKPHVCSEGYQPVPKLPLNFTSSGCNSIGGISTFRMEARHEPGLPCCHMRAACYQICGMSMKKCDDIFKKCNDSICDSIEDEAVKEKCVTATSMHNMLAGMMDCGPFEHQQHNNCGCMEKSKALSWNKKSDS